MTDSKITKIIEVVSKFATAENVEKYVLGVDKNGKPRAIYDVAKDVFSKKKKKKHKKSRRGSTLDIFVKTKKDKKKKKKNKHWHI